MSLFRRFTEPVFLKESSRLSEEYSYLQELCKKNNNLELKKKLKLIEYGVKGENNIEYELRNSHIPMYVLHDINLNYGKFNAQIDYIVITNANVYVIESKNLYGNIKISHNGSFIRSYTLNDKVYKEGIYSPIEQNNKHLELLKLIGYENKKMIDKIIFDKLFYNYYKPLVVLSNHKTILDDRYASDNLKDKIVRVDRLISYIREKDQLSKNKFNKRDMLKIANSILDKHMDEFICYDILYKDYVEDLDEDKNLLHLEKELKKYRYYVANREKKAAFLIFSDKVLKQLISNKPKNKKDLLKIKGLGTQKVEKYGSKIIEIIKKYY